MSNIIARITDEDFNLPKIELKDPLIRYASRGIIINANAEIAVFHKKKKKEYKLPGGGIEKGEDPKEAFKREILEETGCKIYDIDELGITIEEKGQTNFCQISYIFKANVLEDTKLLHLTKKEQEEGGELLWMPLEDAYKVIKECIDEVLGSKYDNKYKTLFMVKRDALILKEYMLKIGISK